MGYYYKCTMEEEGRMVSWTASIDTLRMTASGQYEAELNHYRLKPVGSVCC